MNVRSRAALLTLSAFVLVLRAPASGAQAITDSSLVPPAIPVASVSVEAQHVGPTRAALMVAAQPSVPAPRLAPAASGPGLSQPQALMIVGGAAILVGAIVGDTAGDVFMVGGAVVGLYGLYKYLQ
ncbi:MAG TPA: hypothetical protein VJO33_01145 [Gemmatimonadaceae bacterium]|nr:hypothetical protein [Gemmatimonadaceae bacterium]